MTYSIGQEIHEVDTLGAYELEADYRECAHDWRCWAMLFGQVAVLGVAFIGGIYIIAKLAIILHWQLDANLI